MPFNTSNFGWNMNSFEKDGLIAAWGCRAILNYSRGTLNKRLPLDILGDRQSVVGDKVVAKAITEIWNNHRLSEAVERFTVDHHRETEVVHDLWEPSEHRTNPIEVKIRFSGGYAYIRVGIRTPEPMSEIRDYEEWQDKGEPEDMPCWYSDERPSVGTSGMIGGTSATVLTYVHEGAFQYGIAHTPTWWKERYSSKNGTDDFFKFHKYGRPWSFVRNFVPNEWKN